MKSSLGEVLRDLRNQGIVLSLDESGKLRLRGPKGSLSPELLERTRPYKEALKLIAEKGIVVEPCWGSCGGREAEFIPTLEVMEKSPFRKWVCLECGWEIWRRESGEFPSGILQATLRIFPKSSVVQFIPREVKDEAPSLL
ncbi:hypothetical protein [Candidatus Caldatribacterium saccharofermentans]|uniref:TubC N-terminal docking domain-related protein n=1 Tax=Candidatus Caldatribacterium saccharofermentans TaxID=1454753 RepID=UPI003D01E066